MKLKEILQSIDGFFFILFFFNFKNTLIGGHSLKQLNASLMAENYLWRQK